LKTFARLICDWFSTNKRTLPWRDVSGWYPVFLSEYLLQQTRVKQAEPYFLKIISRFPNLSALAAADQSEILVLWQGLGYYNRARNLLKAAKMIDTRFSGEFPQTLQEAISLPGIGNYTASAILSIAFNKPYPVVDGNVLRIVMRFNLWPEDIRLEQTKTKVRNWLQELIPAEQAGRFNEALMELGATVCKPQKPSCQICPLEPMCQANQSNQTFAFPFKSAPSPKQKKYQIACILRTGSAWFLARRPAAGMLANLWEFPVRNLNSFQELEKYSGRKKILRHSYTHIDLYYSYIFLSDKSELPGLDWYDRTELVETMALPGKAMHKAHLKIIEQIQSEIKAQ